MAEEPIGNHNLSLFSPFVYEDQHIYEVIEMVARMDLSAVPVLDHNNNFLGLITTNELIQKFASLTALNHPGGILVLEMNVNDYSLSQIAQIVESNDAKILSVYLSSNEDSTKMEVILKINISDLTSVIQTFERYNYNIKASYLKDNDEDSLIKNRYELFMRYLNV
jgi:Mg/Co/Ni transporter MgtE